MELVRICFDIVCMNRTFDKIFFAFIRAAIVKEVCDDVGIKKTLDC